jgi:hypothetical protein
VDLVGEPFKWSFERRVMRRVVVDEAGCWLWQGCKMRNGYGQIGVGGRHMAAHRYTYEQKRGPIPAGLDLDHLCRQRACVNPDHLEPVTRRENLLRGVRKTLLPRKTHCVWGHELAGGNLYIHPTGRRCCRACANKRARDRRMRVSD